MTTTRTSIANRKYDVEGFKSFVLAMVQLQPGGEDKLANLKHTKEMIHKAAQGFEGRKPDLIMLPEMFNAPIHPDAHRRHAEIVPTWSNGQVIESDQLPPIEKAPTCHALSQAAKETGLYLIGGSFPERADGDKVYNCLTVWNPEGSLIGKYRKLHLYDVDIPGGITTFESDAITAGQRTLTLKFPFGVIGLGICYDIRFVQMLSAMRQSNPDICAYLLPSAFNLVSGPKAWEVLQRVRAIDNQIYVGMCSPARDSSAKYVTWGHSLVCDPEGKVITEPTPEDESETIIYATIEPAKLISTRQGLPIFASQRNDVYSAASLN